MATVWGGAVLSPEEQSGKKVISPQGEFSFFTHGSIFKVTLHSGYVQALADLGVGSLFYIALFGYGCFTVLANLKSGTGGVFNSLFLLILIGNFTESIVMGPTTIGTFFFWLSLFIVTKEANDSRGQCAIEHGGCSERPNSGKVYS